MKWLPPKTSQPPPQNIQFSSRPAAKILSLHPPPNVSDPPLAPSELPPLLSLIPLTTTSGDLLLLNQRPFALSISLVPENLTSFNSPPDHVMQCPGRIQSRLSWHDPKLYPTRFVVNDNLLLNQRYISNWKWDKL